MYVRENIPLLCLFGLFVFLMQVRRTLQDEFSKSHSIFELRGKLPCVSRRTGFIDPWVVEVKGAERITCRYVHESFILGSHDNVMCTVLLFGSVRGVAINVRITVTNGSAYFMIIESSILV